MSIYMNEAHNSAINPSIDLMYLEESAQHMIVTRDRFSGKSNTIKTFFYEDGSVLVMVGPRVKYYSGMDKVEQSYE